MFKYLRGSLLFIYLLLSSPLFAEKLPHTTLTGAYGGMTVGMGNNSIITDSVFWVGPNKNLMNPTIAQASFNFAGIVGYGLNVLTNVYIGAEGMVGYDSLTSNTQLAVPNTAEYSFDMQIKRNLFTGIAARFGKLYSNNTILFFGRMGVDFGWYKASLYTSSPIVAGISGDPKGDFVGVAVAPGFGIEGLVANNISLRFEYDYEIGINSNKFTYVPSVGKVNSLEYRPSSGIARVGVSYIF